MATRIPVSKETISLLKQCAEPLEDTYDTVITRLAKAWLNGSGDGKARVGAPSVPSSDETLQQHPDAPDDLSHTRVLSASIDGRRLDRPNWNSLLREVHRIGRKQVETFAELRNLSQAHLRDGQYDKEGFRWVEDGDFSVQGVEANLAWRYALDLAKKLGHSLRVEYQWREKGIHPGRHAEIVWNGEGGGEEEVG